LEASLNDFDPEARAAALASLLALEARGEVSAAEVQPIVNLHCHTFHSFNAYGHSPSSLAWLAHKLGFTAAGIVDFDVLDGIDEFFRASDLAGLRASAGIETRVFIPEFADREINSPGEPGVLYHMGIGFPNGSVPVEVHGTLAALHRRAERRNREVLARVNQHLTPVHIDYAADVLPLTPGGNATERHMLQAYLTAAETAFPAEASRAAFWAGRLGVPEEKATVLLGDYAALSNTVRARLMKRGGVGYVAPGPDSFPSVEELHELIIACGALPCAAWLDGTSAGEQAINELLDLLMAKGVVALNLIPDRNWNISDPETRRAKVKRLYEIVEIAAARDLPLNVGTEMNSPGNRVVDDFGAPELAPLRGAFLDGAYMVYGHTALQRSLALGYLSPWAGAHFPNRRQRNQYYRRVGERLAPGPEGLAALRELGSEPEPEAVLAAAARS
jgi:hypothetical protein